MAGVGGGAHWPSPFPNPAAWGRCRAPCLRRRSPERTGIHPETDQETDQPELLLPPAAGGERRAGDGLAGKAGSILCRIWPGYWQYYQRLWARPLRSGCGGARRGLPPRGGELPFRVAVGGVAGHRSRRRREDPLHRHNRGRGALARGPRCGWRHRPGIESRGTSGHVPHRRFGDSDRRHGAGPEDSSGG